MRISLMSVILVEILLAITLLFNGCGTSASSSNIDVADSSVVGISSSPPEEALSSTPLEPQSQQIVKIEEIQEKDLLPNETILAEQDNWSTMRFNNIIEDKPSDTQDYYYLLSNFTVPTEWVELIKKYDETNVWEGEPFFIASIRAKEDLNTIKNRIQSGIDHIENGTAGFDNWSYELVEEVNIKERKWIKWIQSEGAKRRNHFTDTGEVLKCEGWWHYVWYTTTYEDYLVNVVFYYDMVDGNMCITEEEFILQEKVLESWEIIGIVKVIDEQ